jgi:hypothetical protein
MYDGEFPQADFCKVAWGPRKRTNNRLLVLMLESLNEGFASFKEKLVTTRDAATKLCVLLEKCTMEGFPKRVFVRSLCGQENGLTTDL